jgi:hypothetical protein
VARAALVGLSDDDRDREMDVVVAHPRDGIAVVEVKAHRPTIRDGLWHAYGRPMEPQPLGQARDNAYALGRRIRAFHPTLTVVGPPSLGDRLDITDRI